jgi:hypothetical protein
MWRRPTGILPGAEYGGLPAGRPVGLPSRRDDRADRGARPRLRLRRHGEHLARLQPLPSEWMLRLARGCRSRLLHMFGHWINQMDVIAASGKPAGVSTRASAGVDDCGRRRWKMAKKQFLGSGALKLKPAGAKTRRLLRIAVVINNSLDGPVVTLQVRAKKRRPLMRRRGDAERGNPVASRRAALRPSTPPQCAAWFAR